MPSSQVNPMNPLERRGIEKKKTREFPAKRKSKELKKREKKIRAECTKVQGALIILLSDSDFFSLCFQASQASCKLSRRVLQTRLGLGAYKRR